MSEYALTDTEQRIFLAAMERERKICEQFDADKVDDGTCKMLVPVVDSIEKKVKRTLFERGKTGLKEKERLECFGCGFDTKDERFKYCPFCGTKLNKVEKLMTDEELDEWMNRGDKAE